MTDRPNLEASEYYLNHRLSWLRFNRRVLELTTDEGHPLLERVKLLSITASNLDEFVEVRVPRVLRRREAGEGPAGPDGLAPGELLARLDETLATFVDDQYRALEAVRRELADEDIHLVGPGDWSSDERDWAARYFDYRISPVLSHAPVHPDRPFPRVLNGAVNFLVRVERGGEKVASVVVRIPESRPAVHRFPPQHGEGVYRFALLSDIVAEHLGDLFPRGEIRSTTPFRVTRETDVGVEADDVDDLRFALEDELLARPFGDPVRLELSEGADSSVSERLRGVFEVPESRCFALDGPLDLRRLAGIRDAVDRPDLEYDGFSPGRPEGAREGYILEEIDDEDGFVVHRPYQTFDAYVDFVEAAASDPKVVAIKQTVYRTLPDSPVVDALMRAARAGKEVTVVVELQARYDEEKNVELADRLRDAGATVVYGPADHKVHAKLALVVRRDGDTDYRYAHLGTGNYHPVTARQYTDLGYFTADRLVTADVARIFEALEEGRPPSELDVMLAAPESLADGVVRRIEREIAHAHLDRPTGIRAKLNRLTDPEIIEALYRASRAGVEVELVVRGRCRLRPGVEGVSENIHVRSIVGRFLEHSRLYFFENAGDAEIWVASADWREKNLRRRVEHAAPIVDEDTSKRIAREIFDTYLADNTHAWILQSDGTYRRESPSDDRPRWAQNELIDRLRYPGG